MDPFSGYRDMPHEQVNWAVLAQQWMAMKDNQQGNMNLEWDNAARQKPIFPSATNIVFDTNIYDRKGVYSRPPPPPMNNYERTPPSHWMGPNRNEDWRQPAGNWREPPMLHPPPSGPQRTFFPNPPRHQPPPLMTLRPPPPIEDEWSFGWQPPPPRYPPPPKGPPPSLFPSAAAAVQTPSKPYFPPPPSSSNPDFVPPPPNGVASSEPTMFQQTFDDAARSKLPAWIREGLEKAEREKQKQAEKEDRLRQAEEERRKRRELAGKSKFDSDSSEDEDDKSILPRKFSETEESLPRITMDDVRDRALLLIRQFMTTILIEVTDNDLRSSIRESIKDAEKVEATPKLLAKSSALAALSSLGGDDDDSGSETDESTSPGPKTLTQKEKDDLTFKVPVDIPRFLNKNSRGQTQMSNPNSPTEVAKEDIKTRSPKIDQDISPKNSPPANRNRSRSPQKKRKRSRSRDRRDRKRSRSRERKRSRSRERKRSRSRERKERRRSRSRERRHR